MPGFLHVETYPGQPVTVAGHRLTPFHQVVRLAGPRSGRAPTGGLIWNRPVSVLVTRPDGSEQVLPVVDVTRRALWAITAASLLFVLVQALLRSRK